MITQETAASDNAHLLILLSQVIMAMHYYHALQTNSMFSLSDYQGEKTVA